MKKENQKLAIYQTKTGAIELRQDFENENVIWANLNQIALLFDVQKAAISKHLKNIYNDGELSKKATVSILETVQIEGNRKVVRYIEYYNLDAILSVGYRVNSKTATEFRKWATKTLKKYIHNGYVINSEKITHQRFQEIEKDVYVLKQNVKLLKKENITPTEGIFYQGQIYDAYKFINDLLKKTKKEVTLIDNYLDDTVLTLFSKYPKLKFIIITKKISKQLKLDLKKYNQQYKNLTVKISNKYHDRFLITDQKTYHLGASLKDLGKKIFAFAKIDSKLK